MDSRKALFTVLFLVFLDLVGFGMIIPLIALYGKHYGADFAELAILGCAYSLMQFLFSPIWGGLSDRVGRRPILLMSISGSVIAYLIFGLAESYALLLVSRAFGGVFTANISTAHAYVADLTTREERAKYMGLVGAAIGLGFTVGPAFGGISAKYIGLSAPGLLASGLCLVNLLLAIKYLPESLPKEERNATHSHPLLGANIEGIKMVFAHAMLRGLVLYLAVKTFAFAHMEHAFALFLQLRLHIATEDAGFLTGMLMLLMGLVGVIIQGGFIRLLTEKFGEERLVVAGSAICAVAMLAFSFAETTLQFFLLGVPIALGVSLVSPCLNSLISKNADEKKQGITFGVGQGFSSLARVLGPFSGLAAFGLLASLPFYIAGALYVLLTAFAVSLFTSSRLPVHELGELDKGSQKK